MEQREILIAVAPNGARRSQKDHPAIPIGPDEIAETALRCANAGAGMIHLHVRDDKGVHSLDPWRYEQATIAIKERVGDKILIQASSEAAGIFTVGEQIVAIEALMPECISLGLREFIKDESAIAMGAYFLERLYQNKTLIQYILYSPEDIHWYEELCEQGVIPGKKHMLLFVLGRYGKQFAHPDELHTYIGALQSPSPWMVCAFGPNEQLVMETAIKYGGHCRVGFENNLELEGGLIALDNTELVHATAELVRRSNNKIIDARAARHLFTG